MDKKDADYLQLQDLLEEQLRKDTDRWEKEWVRQGGGSTQSPLVRAAKGALGNLLTIKGILDGTGRVPSR